MSCFESRVSLVWNKGGAYETPESIYILWVTESVLHFCFAQSSPWENDSFLIMQSNLPDD